jgi:hypothetical protein
MDKLHYNYPDWRPPSANYSDLLRTATGEYKSDRLSAMLEKEEDYLRYGDGNPNNYPLLPETTKHLQSKLLSDSSFPSLEEVRRIESSLRYFDQINHPWQMSELAKAVFERYSSMFPEWKSKITELGFFEITGEGRLLLPVPFADGGWWEDQYEKRLKKAQAPAAEAKSRPAKAPRYLNADTLNLSLAERTKLAARCTDQWVEWWLTPPLERGPYPEAYQGYFVYMDLAPKTQRSLKRFWGRMGTILEGFPVGSSFIRKIEPFDWDMDATPMAKVRFSDGTSNNVLITDVAMGRGNLTIPLMLEREAKLGRSHHGKPEPAARPTVGGLRAPSRGRATEPEAEEKKPAVTEEGPLPQLLRGHKAGDYPPLFYRAVRHLYWNRREAPQKLGADGKFLWIVPTEPKTKKPLFEELPFLEVVDDPEYRDRVEIFDHEHAAVFELLVYILKQLFKHSENYSVPGRVERFNSGKEWLEISRDCRLLATGLMKEETLKWLCIYARLMCDPSQACIPTPMGNLAAWNKHAKDVNTERLQALVGYTPILRDPDSTQYGMRFARSAEVGAVQSIETNYLSLTLKCQNGYKIVIENSSDPYYANVDFEATLINPRGHEEENVVFDIMHMRDYLSSMLPPPRQIPIDAFRVDLNTRDRAREMFWHTEWYCFDDIRVGIWRPRHLPNHKGFLILYSPRGAAQAVRQAKQYVKTTGGRIGGKARWAYNLIKLAHAKIHTFLKSRSIDHRPLGFARNTMRTAVYDPEGAKDGEGLDESYSTCIVFDIYDNPRKATKDRNYSLRVVSGVRIKNMPERNMLYVDYVGTMVKATRFQTWERAVGISCSGIGVAISMCIARHVQGFNAFKLHNMGFENGRTAYANAAAAVGFKSYVANYEEQYLTLPPLPDRKGNNYFMYFTPNRTPGEGPDPGLDARYRLQDTTKGVPHKQDAFTVFYKSLRQHQHKEPKSEVLKRRPKEMRLDKGPVTEEQEEEWDRLNQPHLSFPERGATFTMKRLRGNPSRNGKPRPIRVVAIKQQAQGSDQDSDTESETDERKRTEVWSEVAEDSESEAERKSSAIDAVHAAAKALAAAAAAAEPPVPGKGKGSKGLTKAPRSAEEVLEAKGEGDDEEDIEESDEEEEEEEEESDEDATEAIMEGPSMDADATAQVPWSAADLLARLNEQMNGSGFSFGQPSSSSSSEYQNSHALRFADDPWNNGTMQPFNDDGGMSQISDS